MHIALRNPLPLPALAAVLLPLAALSDTATWIGGTGNWTDARNWDTGDVPGLTTNVVIDGDENVASVVTLASAETLAVSIGSLTIGSSDALAVLKASIKYTGKTVTLSGTSLSHEGTLTIQNNGNKNDNRVFVTFTQPSRISVGGIVSIAGLGGYKGCHTGFTMPVAGSTNAGVIRVHQPLSQSNNGFLELTGVGQFVNNGRIVIRATGASDAGSAYLRFSYHETPGACSCIDGTGEIILDKEETTVVANNTAIEGVKYNDVNISTHTITNGPQHTIRGTGIIRGCALANAGLVRAEGTNGRLYIENSSLTYGGKPIRNLDTGRMVAMSGTGITIGAGGDQSKNAQFLNEGLLEARAGGDIAFRSCLTTSSNKNTNPATTALDLSGTLAGGGTFSGKPMRLLADATLAPGDLSSTNGTGVSTAGTLTFTTNLVLSAGTTLDFQFGRCEAGQYDSVVVDGALTLAGTLRVSALNGIPPCGTYRIFTCTPGELTGDATSVVLDVAQGMAAPLLTVDSVAGTVDALFPPLETMILVR